ncbi:MAG: alpha/beta hydrolase [Chloroflexota bacterium]
MNDVNIQVTKDLNLTLTISGKKERPTLLLLHAGGENRTVWIPIIERLSNLQWQIIAPDLRGHGQSGRVNHYQFTDFVEDINTVVSKIAGTPLVIVGGSIGGLIGFMIAGQKDSPVNGLISLDVTPHPPTAAGRQEGAKVASAISAGKSQVSTLDPKLASGALVKDILAQTSLIRKRAKNISCPVLLVQGRHSQAVGDKEIKTFRDDIPHAEIITLESGHLIARDHPKIVATLIEEFTAKFR